MGRGKVIYIFRIETSLTDKNLTIRVAANNALVPPIENRVFDWDHLFEIAAKRLGRELGREIKAGPKYGYNLEYDGFYKSIPRRRKAPATSVKSPANTEKSTDEKQPKGASTIVVVRKKKVKPNQAQLRLL